MRRVLVVLCVLVVSATTWAQIRGTSGVTLSRITRSPGPPDSLPVCTMAPPWFDLDLGSGQVPGDTCLNNLTSEYTVTGSGGIFGTVDQGHVAYQLVTGDMQIKARLVSYAFTNGLTSGGSFCSVGARQDATDDNSKFVRALIDGNADFAGAYRLTEGGASDFEFITTTATWLRVRVRSGVGDYAYSTDGTTWIPFGSSRDATLTGTYHLFLGADNINALETTKCVFDSVAIGAPDPDPDEGGEDFGGYRPQIPAAPGYNTSAGRGGSLYLVNTRADNTATPVPCTGTCSGLLTTAICGSGGVQCYTSSFHAAVIAAGARYILFTVCGDIPLPSYVIVNTGNLTIAGQTACSPGVTIKAGDDQNAPVGLAFNASDIVVQHLRVRGTDTTCSELLAMWDYGGLPTGIIFDHVSLSWGQDEQGASKGGNAIWWRSLFAESLVHSSGLGVCQSNQSDSAGHGLLIYNGARHIFVGESVFAMNLERNPFIVDGTRTTLTSNLIYGFAYSEGFNYSSVCDFNNGPWLSTAVNNRFRANPSSTNGVQSYAFAYLRNNPCANGEESGNRIYRSGNLVDDSGSGFAVIEQINLFTYDPNTGSAPSGTGVPAAYTPPPASALLSDVLPKAGARPASRDATDTRIAAYIASRGGSFLFSLAAIGGYPTLSTGTNTLAVPSTPHALGTCGASRTRIECWLETLARAVEP